MTTGGQLELQVEFIHETDRGNFAFVRRPKRLLRTLTIDTKKIAKRTCVAVLTSSVRPVTSSFQILTHNLNASPALVLAFPSVVDDRICGSARVAVCVFVKTIFTADLHPGQGGQAETSSPNTSSSPSSTPLSRLKGEDGGFPLRSLNTASPMFPAKEEVAISSA